MNFEPDNLKRAIYGTLLFVFSVFMIWTLRPSSPPIFTTGSGGGIIAPDVQFYTPANASYFAQNTSVWFNATLNLTNTLKNVTWNWNGTNTTLYNASLVLHYDFDNVSALGDNATLVVDASLAGNNGTWGGNGSCYTTNSKYGNASCFNNTNYINTPVTMASLNTSTGFTFSGCYIHSIDTLNELVMGGFYNQNPSIFTMYGGAVKMIISGISCEDSGLHGYPPFPVGKWYCFVYSYNGTHMYGWIDGIRMTGASCSPSGYAYAIMAGYDPPTVQISSQERPGWGSGFNGSLDAIEIRNRSVTEAEAMQITRTNLAKVAPNNWTFTAYENLSQASHDYQFQLWASNATQTNTTLYQYVTTSATPTPTPTPTPNPPTALVQVWNGSLWVPMNATNKMNFSNCTPKAWCEPVNQNASTSQRIFNVTNNGTTNASLYMRVNYSIPQLLWKCGNTSNYSSAFDKEMVSSFRNMSLLAINQSYLGYCWLNITRSPGYPIPPVQIEFNVTT